MDSTFTAVGPKGERIAARSPLAGPLQRGQRPRRDRRPRRRRIDPQTAADGVAAVPGVPGPAGARGRGPAVPRASSTTPTRRTPSSRSCARCARSPRAGCTWCSAAAATVTRTKRAPMGAAVARLADTAVLTSDNPRSEDPLAILATMLAGAAEVPAHERGEVQVFEDRAAAIAAAVARAQAGRHRAGRGQGPRAGPGHRRGGASLRRPPGASRSYPADPGMNL